MEGVPPCPQEQRGEWDRVPEERRVKTKPKTPR